MMIAMQSLKKWWKNITMSNEERYLQGAANIVDLEHRIMNLVNNQYHPMKGT